MENLTDGQLVEKYLSGDKEALEILIKRYLPQVFGFVFTYTKDRSSAEDITQDVFVKVWRNLKKFKPEYKFKTWVFTIAKNTALDHLKKKTAIPFSSMPKEADGPDFSDMLADERELPLEMLKRKESAEELDSIVRRLSSEQKLILDMRYNKGLKFREIAEILEEPIDTVKTRHRRALARLKGLMNQNDR